MNTMNRFILVGLGNPGKRYEHTRHNAGKMFVRWMNKGQGLRDKGQRNIKAIESESFMNESGEWIKTKMATMVRMAEMVKKTNSSSHFDRFNRLNHLFISHDDLDIPFGKFKIQLGKGPRLHRGIASIEEALGTKEFWRIRIGTDNRINKMATMATMVKNSSHSNRLDNSAVSGSDYVLSNFSKDERKLLETDVFPKIERNLKELLSEKSQVPSIKHQVISNNQNSKF